MSNPLLEVSGLRKLFPTKSGQNSIASLFRQRRDFVHAVKGVSFTIEEGVSWHWWVKVDVENQPWPAAWWAWKCRPLGKLNSKASQ